jgi:hypothetical protein
MRRDTPFERAVGMYTTCRPGSDTWLVARAPFVPIGSFEIWTAISWPSFRTSRIGVARVTRRCCGLPADPFPSSASVSSPGTSAAKSSARIASSTCRNAARSRPTSTNAACIPGRTRVTRPR